MGGAAQQALGMIDVPGAACRAEAEALEAELQEVEERVALLKAEEQRLDELEEWYWCAPAPFDWGEGVRGMWGPSGRQEPLCLRLQAQEDNRKCDIGARCAKPHVVGASPMCWAGPGNISER